MNDYRSVLSQSALIITEWYGLLELQECGRCIRDVGPPQSLVLGLLISPAKPSLLWLPQISVLNGSIQFLIILNQHTIHLWNTIVHLMGRLGLAVHQPHVSLVSVSVEGSRLSQ
jgi:hypothetical protein